MDNRNREIEKFIVTHQKKLYGFIINRVKNEEDADDILQSTMEIVVSKYISLKNPEKINSWIISICKNEIYKYYRNKNKTISLSDMEIYNLETEYEYSNYTNLIKIAIGLLTDDQRDVLQLRFFASMSYKDIALACNISTKKVKSRIFEAKNKLQSILPDLYEGILKPQNYFNSQKEKIIMDIENLKTGSYLFCRLSLPDQLKICENTLEKRDFDSRLIENIGRIRKGKDFLKIFHSKLLLNELIGILNFCDRSTEIRLIKELELVNNQIAETIKQNMFVFDDLVLIDEKLTQVLLEGIEHSDLILSLCNASSQVKNHLLSGLTDLEKNRIITEIGKSDASDEDILTAQQKVIGILREMDNKGEIEIKKGDPGSEYGIKIYLRNKS